MADVQDEGTITPPTTLPKLNLRQDISIPMVISYLLQLKRDNHVLSGPQQSMMKLPFNLSSSAKGIILVTLAASFWGLSGIFVTIILNNSTGTAISLAFWRDLASFLYLLLFTLLTHPNNLKIDKKDLPWLIGMGLSLGCFHIFYNKSVMLNGVSVTTVLQAAMPGIVSLVAYYLWKEELTRAKIGSMILILIGTIMASNFNLFSLGQINIEGITAGAATPLFYAGWIIGGKNVVSKYGASASLTIAFGVASILLLPLQPFTSQPFPLNTTIVMAFIGFIAISTISSFTFYLMGLKHIQAGVASILAMSEILFACLFAWFLLHEHLTFYQISGANLVIIGVFWLSYSQKRNMPLS